MNGMDDAGAPFMAAFNEIENLLRHTLDEDTHTEFSALSREYADKKRLTRGQRDALSAFGALRNAIAHGRYFDGRPIADPVPEIVVEIERLRDLLLRPPSAMSVISTQQVKVVRPADQLETALAMVREYDYSQLPVYDETYVGLLTTNAVARWLAAELTSNEGLPETTSVSNVLEFAERQDQARLTPRTLSAGEAIELLERGEGRAGPIAALIITHSGKAQERPLAVIVRDDLPALYAALATHP
jgi:CBS domain-containing protein